MNIKDRLRLVAQDPRKSQELQQLLLDAAGEIERLEASARPIESTPMVHQCCGRELCDGSDCPNEGPWYKVPKWRMEGYYYSFNPTGNAAIDKILSAVGCAGKAYHHTRDWNDECSPYEHLRGNTAVEWIQNAADDAAASIQQDKKE